jgi:hypothetical protein
LKFFPLLTDTNNTNERRKMEGEREREIPKSKKKNLTNNQKISI